MSVEARVRALAAKWRESARFLASLNNDLPTTKQDIVRFRHCAEEVEEALRAAPASAPPEAEQCLCGECCGDGFDMFPHKESAPPEPTCTQQQHVWVEYETVCQCGDKRLISAPAPLPAPTAEQDRATVENYRRPWGGLGFGGIWTGLMAGFAPAETDRSSTGTFDQGGPVFGEDRDD